MFDCYFSYGVTPAAGTLLVAEVEGCDSPVNGQLAEMQSSTSFSPCDGDFDDDGDVDGSDLAVFANAFGSSSGDPDYSTDCDFNDDGYVNEIDLDSFTRSFGRIDCLGQEG